MLTRLYAIIVKELLQFMQDRLLVLFVLIAPLLQLLLIGGGVGGGVENLPAAVLDQDRSARSREAILALDNTQELTVAYYPDTFAEARALVDHGNVDLLVVLPPDFGVDVSDPRGTASVQLIVDGSNVVVAGTAQSAAEGALESYGWDLVFATLGEDTGLPQGVDLRQEALYNQSLDSQSNDLTTNLAFIVFEIAALVGVMTIVREREIGTLEQVAITPVKQQELIIGKATSPIIIGLVNFLLLLGVVRLIFNTPLRGSLPLLLLFAFLYLVSEACVALMFSAVSQTQGQAITILFMYMMLALTMSGYFVATTQLPLPLRLLSDLLPVQHFITVVRGIMLKGAGLSALWPNAVALLGLDVAAIVITSFALRRVGR